MLELIRKVVRMCIGPKPDITVYGLQRVIDRGRGSGPSLSVFLDTIVSIGSLTFTRLS
jgi:hypothetical protein